MNKRKWLSSHVTAAALFSCGIAFAQAASVMDTIGKNPNLTIATQLINEAGLSPALSGESLLTIFVPNDAAFQALPAAKLNELKSDKELLRNRFELPRGSIFHHCERSGKWSEENFDWQ